MKHSLLIATIACFVVSETLAGLPFTIKFRKSEAQKSLEQELDLDHKFIFSQVSIWGPIKADLYKAMLLRMKDAFESGKYKKLEKWEKQIINNLLELARITGCTQADFDKFNRAYDEAGTAFTNMIIFIDDEREKFDRRCYDGSVSGYRQEFKSSEILKKKEDEEELREVDFNITKMFGEHNENNISPERFKKYLIKLRDANENGKLLEVSIGARYMTPKLIELTELTDCTQANRDKFNKVFAVPPNPNLKSFIKEQKEIFEKNCPDLNQQ